MSNDTQSSVRDELEDLGFEEVCKTNQSPCYLSETRAWFWGRYPQTVRRGSGMGGESESRFGASFEDRRRLSGSTARDDISVLRRRADTSSTLSATISHRHPRSRWTLLMFSYPRPPRQNPNVRTPGQKRVTLRAGRSVVKVEALWSPLKGTPGGIRLTKLPSAISRTSWMIHQIRQRSTTEDSPPPVP